MKLDSLNALLMIMHNSSIKCEFSKLLQENAAGIAVRNLVQNTWRTNITQSLEGERCKSNVFRVFHGTHEVTVTHNGQVVLNTTVEVVKDEDVQINFVLPLHNCPRTEL